MQLLKAQVRQGRLILDEPTDLPEGEVIELVPVAAVVSEGEDDLDDEERAALHDSISQGVDDFERRRPCS